MQLFVISLILCLTLFINLVLAEHYGKELKSIPKSIKRNAHNNKIQL